MTPMTSVQQPSELGVSQRVAAALVAFVLGVSILWLSGFAPISAVHNAAHDGRHVAAFPCH